MFQPPAPLSRAGGFAAMRYPDWVCSGADRKDHAALRKLFLQPVFRRVALQAFSPPSLRVLWPELAPSRESEKQQPWPGPSRQPVKQQPWPVVSLWPGPSPGPWPAAGAPELLVRPERERAAVPPGACSVGRGRSTAARSGDPALPRTSRRPPVEPAGTEFAITLRVA